MYVHCTVQSHIINIVKSLKRSIESRMCLLKKKYRIDQHLARHFKYKGECLKNPPPLLGGQIIPPFLIQWSPPTRIQGCNFSQLWNPYSLILILF